MVTFWNVTTGRQMQPRLEHQGTVNCIAFSPDRSRLVTGSEDKTIRIWNVSTGDLDQNLPYLHDSSVFDVRYSPDGAWIASCAFVEPGSEERTFKLWDARTGAVVHTLGNFVGTVRALAFSPDGKVIASGTADGTITLWSTDTGDELRTLRGHGSIVNAIVFSPNGRRIFSASSDQTVKVWNTATGEELLTLRGHEGEVVSVAVSRDGRTVASASLDGTVKVWETNALPLRVYRMRQTVERARRIVDKRFDELTFVSDVIESLKGDEAIDSSVRKVALQIATTRGDALLRGAAEPNSP